MTLIHPTAIIDSAATLAENVEVGPYCVVTGNVSIGAGTKLVAHVHITATGRTVIGEQCTIYPFASLGSPPQDLKYHGEPSELLVGDRNQIREYVTINPGTEGGGMVTRVGSDCLFMIASHIAHDCQIGDRVILANNATLAGHVELGEHAIIGGMAALHQYVRVGAHAIVGGGSALDSDVIPYASVMGERAGLAGLNLIGLKRRGFERERIHALRHAYKELFESSRGTFAERVEKLQAEASPEVKEILHFITNRGSRALCTTLNSQPSAA